MSLRFCRRTLVEVGPPLLVALVLLPVIISGGHLPWKPSTLDLYVYRYAVGDMLAGKDIYQTVTPNWLLTFIYPPIAAVLMVPLAFGPFWVWQLLWTLGSVAAQQEVLRRCGAPRGWRLGLLGVAAVLAVEPIRTTLGYGQVNVFLMFLVVVDLLPRAGASPGRRRLPSGVWIGLATAIKLTPALFAVFALVRGRWKITLTAFLSFVGFTLFGAIFQPRQTWFFWTTLATGDTRAPSGPIYVGNQSWLGVVARVVGESRPVTLLGLGSGLVIALLSVMAGRYLWMGGTRADRAAALGVVGVGTCLASPLAWTHHYVWVLPLGVGLLMGARLPRGVRALGLAWCLWTAVGLPLAVLPYGKRVEVGYTWFQDLIGAAGPLLAVAFIVACCWPQCQSYLLRKSPTVVDPSASTRLAE